MVRRRQSKSKRQGSGGAAKLLALLFILFLAVAAWLVFTPYGPESETFVDLAPGSSTMQIAKQLESAGVIRSQYAFDLVRWVRRGRLRAGEYRFDHPVSVAEVYARLSRGDVYTRSVTIPEGASIFEIGDKLEQAGLGTKQDFLEAVVTQASLVRDLDPAAKSLEGYLFPDTYRFARNVTAEQICATMVRRFRTATAQLGGLGKANLHRVVTIASLVERETAVDAERPLVASVFENRLAKKMPLMTDPSVIYGLEESGRWRGTIYQSDLKYDTPYNTYLHAGLPPGPVANPGIKSLRAALHPAHTDYLYFVAAGVNAQGRSLFAATLDEHNRNVTQYRHALKQAGAQ